MEVDERAGRAFYAEFSGAEEIGYCNCDHHADRVRVRPALSEAAIVRLCESYGGGSRG